MKRNTILALICTIVITMLLFIWGYVSSDKQLVGIVGACIGAMSGLLHVTRAWQGKITLKAVSWAIWALIGIAVCITYKKAGDPNAFWPTLGNAAFPIINLVYCLFYWQKTKGGFDPLTKKWDIRALICGGASIGLYIVARVHIGFDEYANYIAIVADLCALIPTVVFVRQYPMQDRPLAWYLFSVGFGLAVFAVSDGRYSSYALPLYMMLGSALVWVPLIRRRIKHNIPLRKWYGVIVQRNDSLVWPGVFCYFYNIINCNLSIVFCRNILE